MRFRSLACGALAAACACASPASAQERARDFITPRLSKTQFQQLCQKVGLQSDQRQIANIAFGDYETSLNELAEALDAQALAAGRQSVDDSLSGKARMAADDLKRARAEVYKAYLDAGPGADDAMDMLIGAVEVLLTDDQAVSFDSAHKWLNREVLLHPRASAAAYQEYAGDGVDVLQLAEEARGDDGELAGLPADALSGILNRYEDDLDQVLIETFSPGRQGQLLRKIAGIEKDADTLKREEQAAVKRWQRLYDLNRATVNAVAAAAEPTLGAAAGKAFQQRFDRASFTWLYPRRTPDRQIEWMRREAEKIDPAALAAAETVYAGYLKRRDGLSRAAIDMMLKARFEFQTFLYAMMDQAAIDERVKSTLYADLLKNTGEQSHLETTTSSHLETLLDAQTLQAMRDAMKRLDRTGRRPPTPR